MENIDNYGEPSPLCLENNMLHQWKHPSRAADACATLLFAIGVVWAAGACGNNSAHKVTDECLDGEILSGLIALQGGTHWGVGEARALMTGRAIATSVIRVSM